MLQQRTNREWTAIAMLAFAQATRDSNNREHENAAYVAGIGIGITWAIGVLSAGDADNISKLLGVDQPELKTFSPE